MMFNVSRRHFLAASVATTAAAGANILPPNSAHAQAAAPPAPLTGFFAYKYGDAEIIQVFDGARTMPIPDGFITNLSKEETHKAYAAQFMPPGQLTISFSPLLVKAGGKTIAIDTGNGLAANAVSKGAVGNARHSMAAAGVDPKAVDIVLITHFHGDHINGLKNADGTPSFPNAEIMVPARELAFWSDDSNAGRTNASNKGNFANVKKVFDGLKPTPFEVGKEVAPGITSIATPGHTPGHVSFVIASGGKTVIVEGDISNHPAIFMANPGWHAAFDNDGALAEATRRKFFDMVAADKTPVIGFHFPFPSVGYVEKAGSGYRLVQVHGLA